MKHFLSLLLSFFSIITSAALPVQKDGNVKSFEDYHSTMGILHKKANDAELSEISVKKLSPLQNFSIGFPKNAVVEEATGTWCGYCPRGIVMCEYIREHYSDRIFTIAVHQGDKMETDDYADFFIRYVSSFPTAIVDRREEMLISTESADILYNQIKDQQTYAKIDLSARLENNILQIDSEAEFAADTDTEHRLAFVVAEDNVGPYVQTNYYTGSDSGLGMWDTSGNQVICRFDDVARHVKTFDGIAGSLPDYLRSGEKYRYTATMELTNVGSPFCKVIAMIINCETGEIVNAARFSVESSEGLYVDKGMLNMVIGERERITAYINGISIGEGVASWSSSDEKVVIVDSLGNLEAVGEGEAVVTVSCDAGSAQCRVHVSLVGSVFEVDGIRYKISSKDTCMVAIPEEGEHYMMEKIVIPSEIEAIGRRFEVNELEFSMESFTSAFNRSPNLVEIELPNTITYIPGDAFEYCQQLRKFKVPDSVWFIDAFAFTGCSSLSDLVLNEGLTGLWTWSCAWCSSLKNITLPSTLEEMGREVFYGTNPFWIQSKAQVPPCLQGDLFNDKSIVEDYYECALLVPEESIDAYRNAEYWHRFEMIVPDNVILNRYKLRMNPGDEFQLEVVNCNGRPVAWQSADPGIVAVGDDGNIKVLSAGETTVIAECGGKTAECRIISSLEGQRIMSGGLWYEINRNNTCSVIRNCSSDEPYQMEDVEIPYEVEVAGQKIEVTAIASEAFKNCEALKRILLSNSIRTIGTGSFWGCSGLSELGLNEGVEKIGTWGIANCCNLESIVLPSTLTTIEMEAFAGTSPKRIQCKSRIPPVIECDLFDVSEIAAEYADCALIVPEVSLSSYSEAENWKRFEIIVPDDVILNTYRLKMNPGDESRLEVINSYGKSVTWISSDQEIVNVDGDGVIRAVSVGETTIIGECDGKTAECRVSVSLEGLGNKINGIWYRITGENTCEVISSQDSDCYDFESLFIPSVVELSGKEYFVSHIEDDSFYNCFALQEVELPVSLSSIGDYSFHNCDALKEINLPEQLNAIGRAAFGGCHSLGSIHLPENITEIKESTFVSCVNLKEVILPGKLESIEAWSFENCRSLEEIVIPPTVIYMGSGCFADTKLQRLRMECQKIPEVVNDLFFRDADLRYEVCELIVPEDLLEQYRNHPVFGKFANIKGYSSVQFLNDEARMCDVYSIGGSILERNISEKDVTVCMMPGIYILRYSDTTTKKVVVR